MLQSATYITLLQIFKTTWLMRGLSNAIECLLGCMIALICTNRHYTFVGWI